MHINYKIDTILLITGLFVKQVFLYNEIRE